MAINIEVINKENLHTLANLMVALWPEASLSEELHNCLRILQAEDETCYLSKYQNDHTGFIYLSLRRDYVEGATTSLVAYIEGLFVEPLYRKAGHGKALVEYGAAWAREKGCTEYASDTEWHNEESIAFHKKAGFQEANRIVCFIRSLK